MVVKLVRAILSAPLTTKDVTCYQAIVSVNVTLLAEIVTNVYQSIGDFRRNETVASHVTVILAVHWTTTVTL